MLECLHNNHIPEQTLNYLHESQAGFARHKCPICAWRIGLDTGAEFGNWHAYADENEDAAFQNCAEQNVAPVAELQELPTYQGGLGRHRCAVCAFRLGFDAGALHTRIQDLGYAPLNISNPVSREMLRRALVELFLSEPPGTGTGQNATRKTYIAETNLAGYNILLKRPARLRLGFDFVVCLEGHNFSETRRARDFPRHGEVIDDLSLKWKEDTKAYAHLYELLDRVHLCLPVDLYAHELPTFTVGRPSSAILGLFKWLFAEQDMHYWNYSGRAKLWHEIPKP